MKLLAVNRSSSWRAGNGFSMNNDFNDDNEVTFHSVYSDMTSRPLKKVKYACGLESVGHSPLSSSGDNSATNSSIQRQASTVANNIHTEINDKPEITAINDFDREPVSTSSRLLSSESTSQNEEDLGNDAESNGGGDGGGGGGSSSSEVDSSGHGMHYALRLWQSRQIAQGIFDNVINKVLGELGVPLHLNDPGNHNLNEFVNWGSFLNAQNIENEGVAEAIRQQGLQRKRFEELWRHQQRGSSCGSNGDGDKLRDNAHRNLKASFYTPSHVMSDGSGCASPAVLSGDGIYASVKKKSDQEMTSKQLHLTSQSSSSSSSTSYGDEILKQQGNCDEVVTVSSELIDDIEVSLRSEDLLNTAVSCAISEKGLEVLNEND